MINYLGRKEGGNDGYRLFWEENEEALNREAANGLNLTLPLCPCGSIS